jgi:hypothetical protein
LLSDNFMRQIAADASLSSYRSASIERRRTRPAHSGARNGGAYRARMPQDRRTTARRSAAGGKVRSAPVGAPGSAGPGKGSGVAEEEIRRACSLAERERWTKTGLCGQLQQQGGRSQVHCPRRPPHSLSLSCRRDRLRLATPSPGYGERIGAAGEQSANRGNRAVSIDRAGQLGCSGPTVAGADQAPALRAHLHEGQATVGDGLARFLCEP